MFHKFNFAVLLINLAVYTFFVGKRYIRVPVAGQTNASFQGSFDL